MQLPGRERARPDDPVVVGALLDRRGDDPRRPDPVAAHDDRVLHPVLVEVGRAERLGVAGSELEDVADLDRGLDLDPPPSRRRVAGLDRADVRDLELEVAPGLDALQVPSASLAPATKLSPSIAASLSQHGDAGFAPTGPTKPTGPSCSAISSSPAGRKSAPR